MVLKNLNYPLDFTFKITTLSSDFNITDQHGKYIAYVRQKMFKLKEDVIVFSDETKTKELYRIQANKWIDFNSSYNIQSIENGENMGKLARKGMKSLWKTTYHIFDNKDQNKFQITEKNVWIEVFDSLLGEIPILSFFTGYFFNPTYLVTDGNGIVFFELKKMPSFFGRKFKLERNIDIDDESESLVVLSLLMMVLLERSNG